MYNSLILQHNISLSPYIIALLSLYLSFSLSLYLPSFLSFSLYLSYHLSFFSLSLLFLILSLYPLFNSLYDSFLSEMNLQKNRKSAKMHRGVEEKGGYLKGVDR